MGVENVGGLSTGSNDLVHFSGTCAVKGGTGFSEPFKEDRIIVSLDSVVRFHVREERGPEIHLPEDSGLGEPEK
jgi:hypothetical protein